MLLLYPQFANRDCQHCLKYEYNEGTGEPRLFNGKPLLRHSKNPPLCKTRDGCPKGTPEKPNTLTPKNRQAYIHHLECKAVYSFPDDPIVRRNARMIQFVVDRSNEQKRAKELIALMGVTK